MSSCVLVSNLPPNITEDKLTIYFQRAKNGGGDVRSIELLENGEKAIVEFEDEKTITSILEKEEQRLNGRKLKIIKCEKKVKIFSQIYAKLSPNVVRTLGPDKLQDLVGKLEQVELEKRNNHWVVQAENLKDVQKLKVSIENLLSQEESRQQSIHQSADINRPSASSVNQSPAISYQRSSQSGSSPGSGDQPSTQIRGLPNGATGILGVQRKPGDMGARRKVFSRPAPVSSSRSGPPFPQPDDGTTFSENIRLENESCIKRMFCFPAGFVNSGVGVQPYPSYERVAKIPQSREGEIVDDMLEQAFAYKKLFYIGKDITGTGFKIYSAFEILGSGRNNEEDMSGNLAQIQSWLSDLDVPYLSAKKQKTISENLLASASPEPEPMDISSSKKEDKKIRARKIGQFPQPTNLVSKSELHNKHLEGFPDVEAIHMYFRFAGGTIQTEDGPIQYLSYNRTACLPATDIGKRLYGMVQEAVRQRKLFVVAMRNEKEFCIKTKVPLMTSDDYPCQDQYFKQLSEGLSKLGISEPISLPPLPPKVEIHYEEKSDDEEEGPKQLAKRGPHPQPENGVLKLEREDNGHLDGFGSCGIAKMFFRFAGGKMMIQGSKPSKSYEVPYSPLNLSASLPNNDQGRQLVFMIRTAFNDKKLFYVYKGEGEPAFRIRSNVNLIPAGEYPKPGYLQELKRELKKLGMNIPSRVSVDSMDIPNATLREGGAVPQHLLTQPQPAPRSNTISRNAVVFPKQGGVAHAAKATPNHTPSVRTVPRPNHQRMNLDSPPRLTSSDSANHPEEEEEKCAICLDVLSSMRTRTLPCKHVFHESCVAMATKDRNMCPMCKQPLGASSPPLQQNPLVGATPQFGNIGMPVSAHSQNTYPGRLQPQNLGYPWNGSNARNHTNLLQGSGIQPANGRMMYIVEPQSLPGYEGYGTIVIRYLIPGGVQGMNHPNPGVPYYQTQREAYLPDNADGQDLLRLLKVAFDRGLTFKVGKSLSSGKDNQVIWSGIPHKTNRQGGIFSYGYPDSNYLTELRKALSDAGVV